jgi:chemotaxis response regulator CheB
MAKKHNYKDKDNATGKDRDRDKEKGKKNRPGDDTPFEDGTISDEEGTISRMTALSHEGRPSADQRSQSKKADQSQGQELKPDQEKPEPELGQELEPDQEGPELVWEPEPNQEKEPDEVVPPFPIVGIGASAGGLDPLKTFFNLMPSHERIAFVVIQHLDPKHKSYMGDLIQKYTSM